MMRSFPSSPVRRFGGSIRLMSLLASILVGLALGVLVLKAPDGTAYQQVLLACAGLLLFGMIVVADARRVLLVSLAFVIPISVAFAPFQKSLPYHPGGPSPTLVLYPYDFALVGLLGLWLLEGLVARKAPRFSAIDLCAFLLIVWSALSILNSTQVAYSVAEVLRMAKLYLLSILVAANVKSRRDLQDVLVALLAGLFLQTGVSVLEYLSGSNFGFTATNDLHRVAGTVGWPNTLGAYVAALMAVGLALWMIVNGGRLRVLAMAATVAGFIPLVLTLSRGAWLALVVAVVVTLLLGIARGWVSGSSLVRLVALLLAVGMIGLFFSDAISARLAQTSLLDSSITDRVLLADVATNMITAHPVLGVGVNTFVDVMHGYDVSGVTYRFPEPVHNVFLLVAAETGLVGLGLFLLLLVAVFQVGLRAAGSKDRFLSGVSIGLVTSLVVLCVSNLFDVHLRTDVIYGLFWLLIGLVVAVRRLSEVPAAERRS